MSPALAGGVSSTAPPRKPNLFVFNEVDRLSQPSPLWFMFSVSQEIHPYPKIMVFPFFI